MKSCTPNQIVKIAAKSRKLQPQLLFSLSGAGVFRFVCMKFMYLVKCPNNSEFKKIFFWQINDIYCIFCDVGCEKGWGSNFKKSDYQHFHTDPKATTKTQHLDSPPNPPNFSPFPNTFDFPSSEKATCPPSPLAPGYPAQIVGYVSRTWFTRTTPPPIAAHSSWLSDTMRPNIHVTCTFFVTSNPRFWNLWICKIFLIATLCDKYWAVFLVSVADSYPLYLSTPVL